MTSTDVEHLPLERLGMPHCGQVGGDGVGHVGEISGLAAVTVDGRPLALRHELDEQRDHAAVRAGRILPGAEDVEVAQAHAVQAHGLSVNAHVLIRRRACRRRKG